jgi:hypothetical protein
MADRLPLLIFTFNPENTVSQHYVDGLFAKVAAAGGEVIPVELFANESKIEERIGSESRRREGKVMDVPMYRNLRARGAFDSPVIPAPRLRIDTGEISPAEAAVQIASLVDEIAHLTRSPANAKRLTQAIEELAPRHQP